MPNNMTDYGVKQKLPYSWYRNHFIQNQNLDDAGNSSQPISEDQWNAMDPNQQYGAVQIGSYGVDPNDEVLRGITDRYAAAGNQGRGVMVNDVNKFNGGSVWTDPTTGIKMTDPSNVYKTPDRINPAIGVGTVLTAGLLGNALMSGSMLGGASSGGAPGLLSRVAPSTVNGSGLLSAPLFEGAGAEGIGSLLSGVTPSTAGAGGLLEAPLFNLPEVAGAGAGGYSGVDLSGLEQAGGPASGHSFGGGLSSQSAIGGGGLFSGGLGDIAGRAGSWAMSNPLQALGLGQAAAGLFAGGQSGGNRGGGGSPGNYSAGSKGGSGQFTPNPYTVAQLQRYQRGLGQ